MCYIFSFLQSLLIIFDSKRYCSGAIMSVALVYLGLVEASPGEGGLPRCIDMKGKSGCLVLSLIYMLEDWLRAEL